MSRQSVLVKLDDAGKKKDGIVIQLKKRMEELGKTLLSMEAIKIEHKYSKEMEKATAEVISFLRRYKQAPLS